MKRPRPLVYSLEEVVITRDDVGAHIRYRDPGYGETVLTLGPKAREMSDQEIVELYNDTLRAAAEHARDFNYVAIEPPLGSPQIEYHADAGQWSPRGHVLRCLVEDGAENGREPIITIDDKELTWHEFSTMLCTFAGWGMRIEFTPEDAVHRRPAIKVEDRRD